MMELSKIAKKSTRRGVRRNDTAPSDIAKKYCIEEIDPDYIIKQFIHKEIGFGVFATNSLAKGSFIVEYAGELLDDEEGAKREIIYEEKQNGCFLYFFQFKGKNKCVDATLLENRIARYINHSYNPNCRVKVLDVNGIPKLCIFAGQDIEKGEELRYKYDDPNLHFGRKYNKPYKLDDLLVLQNKSGPLQEPKPGSIEEKMHGLLSLKKDKEECRESEKLALKQIGETLVEIKACFEDTKKIVAENEAYNECDTMSLKNIELTPGEIREFDEAFRFKQSTVDLIKMNPLNLTEVDFQKCNMEVQFDPVITPDIEEKNSSLEMFQKEFKTGILKKAEQAISIENEDEEESCMCGDKKNLKSCGFESCMERHVLHCMNCLDNHVCSKIKEDGTKIQSIIPKMIEERNDELSISKIEKNIEVPGNTRSVKEENITLKVSDIHARVKLFAGKIDQECSSGDNPDYDKQICDMTKWIANKVLNNETVGDAKKKDCGKKNSYKKSGKVLRRKVKCPVPGCSAERSHLKEHLMTIHKWTPVEASCARVNLNLNLQRSKLPDNERKTKARDYKKKRCPFLHCQKEVLRMENHLKQYHKLEGVEYKYQLHQAEFVTSENKHSINSSITKPTTEIKTILKSASCEPCDDGNPPDLIQPNEDVLSALEITEEEVEMEDDVDYEDIDDKIIIISKEEELFLERFYIWLGSCDAGFKKPRSASQHRSVVMKILHFIDPSGKDYTKLFSRPDLNRWITYMEQKQKRKPGTIKTYLGSLKLFYLFVTITCPSEVIVNGPDMNRMREIVNQWCRNFFKKIKIASHKKHLDDLVRLPLPEEIIKLDQSAHQERAIKFISNFLCHDTVPSRAQYCHVRDYLVTNIILDNAARAGAIANLTIEEYGRAELQPADGSSIIMIMDHKTIASEGPAMISLSSTLMHHFTVFVEKIRNRLPDITYSPLDTVFVSWSGKRMATSMICQQLSTYWKQATGKNLSTDRNVTSTLLRKMATTAVHGNHPELKNDLAALMNHNVRTAEKCYYLHEKKKGVVATSTQLRSIIRTRNKSAPTTMTNQQLTEIFKGYQTVTMADVREEMEKHEPLQHQFTEKQLLDKIIYLRKTTQPLANIGESSENEISEDEILTEKEDEDSEISDDEFSRCTSVRSRARFSPRNIATLQNECRHIIRSQDPIISSELKKLLTTNKKLKPLYEKFGFSTLKVKMRTERNKFHYK